MYVCSIFRFFLFSFFALSQEWLFLAFLALSFICKNSEDYSQEIKMLANVKKEAPFFFFFFGLFFTAGEEGAGGDWMKMPWYGGTGFEGNCQPTKFGHEIASCTELQWISSMFWNRQNLQTFSVPIRFWFLPPTPPLTPSFFFFFFFFFCFKNSSTHSFGFFYL